MTKIYNRDTLDQEIDRLKNLAAAKENNLQNAFQELSNNLTPANLISSGFKSIFNRSPLSKPLISTGIGLLSGLFIEKVILKNANILVKYGIAQVWDYIKTNNIPYNKLHDQGFPSIGNLLIEKVNKNK